MTLLCINVINIHALQKVLINKSNEIVKVVSVNRNKYKKHVNLNEEKEEIIFERLKYKYIKNLLKGKQIDDD